MVNGDHRQLGIHQLQHLGIGKIHTGDDHPVHTPVAAVLQIGGAAAHIAVDEGHIVAPALGLHLQAFQHGGEIRMGQTAVLLVHEEDADVVGPVGLQGPGGGVGHIAHLLGGCTDPVSGFGANVRLAVQGLAHRGNGNAAALGNVLHADHIGSTPFDDFPQSFS